MAFGDNLHPHTHLRRLDSARACAQLYAWGAGLRAALRAETWAQELLATGNLGAGRVGWWGGGPRGGVAGRVGGWRAGGGGPGGGWAGQVGRGWKARRGGGPGGGGSSGVLAGQVGVGGGVRHVHTAQNGVCMAE